MLSTWILMCPTDVFFTYPQAQCTTPHRIKQFSYFLVSNCGSILHGPSGSFQSTNFPNNYLSDEYCTWKVQVPLGKKVRLEFEEFRTEENKDFVLIYDSGKTDPIIGFSGVKDKPRAITSSGNSIRVRFISNGENANNGFKVAYKQTGECRPVGIDSLSIGIGEKWTLLERPTLANALAVFYFVKELATFIKQFSTFGYPSHQMIFALARLLVTLTNFSFVFDRLRRNSCHWFRWNSFSWLSKRLPSKSELYLVDFYCQ